VQDRTAPTRLALRRGQAVEQTRRPLTSLHAPARFPRPARTPPART
jgi:hypothetical protein